MALSTGNHSISTTHEFLLRFDLQKEDPTLLFLSKLVRAFGAIPYENATKMLKVRSGLEGSKRLRLPEEVLEDHLRYGTGGTCFSLTFFFHTILNDLGFESYPVMGDRTYGTNTHCALIVRLQNESFLVDPGFLVDFPLPLQSAPHAVFRTMFNEIDLVSDRATGDYDFYTVHQQNKKWRYRLKTAPVSWEQFYQFWSDSFSWKGLHSLVITAVRNGRQIYCRNNHLRIVTPDGILRQTVKDPQDLKAIFGIDASLLHNAWEATPF